MTQYLDLEGLKKFKEKADELYKPIKGTIPLTGSINLTKETVLSLGAKYALIANNTINFYVIADSNGKLPSDETRINVNSDITSLVGAEGANVGDIFVIGKLDLKPVYKIIPLNDAKAANADFKGTQGVVTPWDKTQINKVPNLESALNSAKNNLPTRTESNMNNALQTGFYPWCTLGRPAGSTGAYTLVTLASSTADSAGYTTIEQTAYGRQNDELGKIFKRIIFKKDGDVQLGEWKEIDSTGGGIYDSLSIPWRPKPQDVNTQGLFIQSAMYGEYNNSFANVGGDARYSLAVAYYDETGTLPQNDYKAGLSFGESGEISLWGYDNSASLSITGGTMTLSWDKNKIYLGSDEIAIGQGGEYANVFSGILVDTSISTDFSTIYLTGRERGENHCAAEVVVDGKTADISLETSTDNVGVKFGLHDTIIYIEQFVGDSTKRYQLDVEKAVSLGILV